MSAVYRVWEPGNGTRYEILLYRGPTHDVVALPNFRVCMPLPGFWAQGLDVEYVATKLKMREVDAAAVIACLMDMREVACG